VDPKDVSPYDLEGLGRARAARRGGRGYRPIRRLRIRGLVAPSYPKEEDVSEPIYCWDCRTLRKCSPNEPFRLSNGHTIRMNKCARCGSIVISEISVVEAELLQRLEELERKVRGPLGPPTADKEE